MEEIVAQPLVLVTGATGYIGGRLVPRLLQAGYRVRCLVRDPHGCRAGPGWIRSRWSRATSCIPRRWRPPWLAFLRPTTWSTAWPAGRASTSGTWWPRATSAQPRRAAGVGRIIYLGGLGDPETELSQHLRSRQETGDALREGGVPVTEFRAGVIVGSGSLSFEMIRYLIERLPVMICPRWVYTCIQPIGIRNVLEYLIAALETPESAGEIIEIGGADVLTYRDMMLGYAKARG